MRTGFPAAMLFAVLIGLSACGYLYEPPPPAPEPEAPDEMPAPDAVPAGRVTAEPLEAPPGIEAEPGPNAAAPRRTVLATTRPAPSAPMRLRELVPMTASEMGRVLVGHYLQHGGGRVLHLRPNGQAMIARQGAEPQIQTWMFTGDDRLCLTSGAVRTCQQVFRVGDEFLLAAEDGNQRLYRRLSNAPAWL